jgi:hypothetical protein
MTYRLLSRTRVHAFVPAPFDDKSSHWRRLFFWSWAPFSHFSAILVRTAFANRLMLRRHPKTAYYRFAYFGPLVVGFAPLRSIFLLPVLTCSGSWPLVPKNYFRTLS